MRLRPHWPWLVLIGAFVLWLTWGGSGSPLPEGQPAPALAIPWSVDEAGFDLSEQRGHVTVLAFWATWCPPCRAEGPVLSRVHRRIERHGDRVVGVSVDQAPLPAIASTARSLGMTYPIALADSRDSERFHVDLLPTIVVVDAQGRVASYLRGTASEDDILEAVEAARHSAAR
jgi:thiol-disulfide isomerase/thioredoxin